MLPLTRDDDITEFILKFNQEFDDSQVRVSLDRDHRGEFCLRFYKMEMIKNKEIKLSWVESIMNWFKKKFQALLIA